MTSELPDLYRQAATWTIAKVAGARNQLDAATPCDEWDVRTLLNHMLETQRYVVATGKGREATPPAAAPPSLISDDPTQDFIAARDDLLATYADPAVLEKAATGLGVAFSDILIHGWDVAQATNQDAAMPAGLAEAAYNTIHGKFSDEQRQGLFKPEVAVPANADAQTKLLAYAGRQRT